MYSRLRFEACGPVPRSIPLLALALLLGPGCSDESATGPEPAPPASSSIEDFAGGFDRSVTALATYEGELIAGGDFLRTRVDGDEMQGIARLRDGQWEPFGGSLTGGVQALTSWDGSLVAAGFFNRRQQASADFLCRWDGAEWREFVGGLSDAATALLEFRGDLIVGGRFDRAGHTVSPYVARFSAGGWWSMGRGMDAPVTALVEHQSRIYAGGGFSRSGTGESLAGVARWSGENWEPVDVGIRGTVATLASYRGRLVAGGTFDLAGTMYARNVAMLGPVGWDAMGRGLDGPVLSLTVVGDCLYAAGLFGKSGEAAIPGLARWTGRSWQPVVGTMNGFLSTSHLHEGRLVLGGSLTSIQGEPTGNIAALDPVGCTMESFREPQEEGPGLLQNWDAEAPVAIGDPEPGDGEWFYFDGQNTGYLAEVDAEVAHTGSRSLRIDGPIQRVGFGYWGQIVREGLPFGKPLRFEAWVRTDRVHGRGASIAIRADGAEGPRLFESTGEFRSIGGSSDWRLYHVGIPELPEDIERVAVYLVLANSTGSVWFDRMSLTMVE